MRNITFDESTVLGEFARIMHEKELVKIAGDEVGISFDPSGMTTSRNVQWTPAQNPKQHAQYLMTKVFGITKPNIHPKVVLQQILPKYSKYLQTEILPKLQNAIMSEKVKAEKYNAEVRQEVANALFGLYGQRLPMATIQTDFLIPAAQAYATIVSGAGQNASDGMVEKQAADANPLKTETDRLNSLYAKLKTQYNNDEKQVQPVYQKEVQSTVDRLKKQYGNHPAIQTFETQAKNMGRNPTAMKTQSAKYNISKRAKESSLYDVSGETGEQLVDSAHPGNTKTEVSMKTKENVVETIVEQQERDLAVVNKMPKGTYAALLDLADKLDKRGFNDIANRVDEIIRTAVGAAPADALQYQEAKARSSNYSDMYLKNIISQIRSKFQMSDQINHIETFMQVHLFPLLGKSNGKMLIGQLDKALSSARLPPTVVHMMTPIFNDAKAKIQADIGGVLGQGGPSMTAKEPVLPLQSIPGKSPANKRVQWIRYYNKIPGVTPVSEESAASGDADYKAAIQAVRDSGAKTLAEFAATINQPETKKPTQTDLMAHKIYQDIMKNIPITYGIEAEQIPLSLQKSVYNSAKTWAGAGLGHDEIVEAVSSRVNRQFEEWGYSKIS